ncbi:type I restriction enzyme, S subunit [Desulfocicer vacuolatum DSM 3385]|uniref:Type I restriction enzyme, S subunit n=1 Tax=Desulfocicer vacuolatum DSM 3385 TaxID=1121400 RepID=A0A1W2D3Q7_9BACT|nr:restriction endonuclease subunit S [Desulfocicer vacuolatum]SMC92051.1 type I restriction enzyme, S subunit [Desulfocicer vacuolatum DSM 3385]
MGKNKSLLPSGWTVSKFGDIVKVQGGYAFKAKKFTDSGVPVIRIGDLRDGNVTVSEKTAFLPSETLENHPTVQLKKEDILMALSGATTGKNAIFDLDTPALLNQRVGRFLPYSSENINNGFLKFLIKKVSEGVLEQAWGGAQPNVSPTTIESNSISIPPLNEQKRIADKIEALQAKSNKAKKALETAKPLLDKLRQSILAAAFRGDLTAEWRKKNPDVEPASILLERIRVERRKRWEETELAKMKAKGKEPKNDKWKAKYKVPEPVDATGLPELAEGWCWTRLDDIGTWSGGGTPSKNVSSYWENGNIPWITPKDMKKLFVSNSIDKITASAVKESSAKIIAEGSLLFVVRSGILRRILPLCTNTVQTTVNQDLKALTPVSSLAVEFLLYAALAVEGKIRHQCAKSGTTVESIDFKKLKNFIIPLPPNGEQLKIVKRIDQGFLSIEKISTSLISSEDRICSLNKSILAKAFRGELVPQDPTDEPASALLDRIKAEREAMTSKKKITKKRKQST